MTLKEILDAGINIFDFPYTLSPRAGQTEQEQKDAIEGLFKDRYYTRHIEYGSDVDQFKFELRTLWLESLTNYNKEITANENTIAIFKNSDGKINTRNVYNDTPTSKLTQTDYATSTSDNTNNSSGYSNITEIELLKKYYQNLVDIDSKFIDIHNVLFSGIYEIPEDEDIDDKLTYVKTFNGRSGDVVPQAGDYNTDQVTEGAVNKYMTSAERTKLAGIEDGAEVNQTDAEIKTQYENNPDTNAFTDAEKTKLAGVEDGAEVNQTDAEIKTQYENNPDTNAFTDQDKTDVQTNNAKVSFPEAPQDGNQYARKNAGWEQVVTGSGNVAYWVDIAEAPTTGDGTSGNPYLIEKAEHLAWVAKNTNASAWSSGKYFTLASAIDLKGKQFEPIGTSTNRFEGIFTNADVQVIDGLTITNFKQDYCGLFGYVGSSGRLPNVKLLNVNIQSNNSYVGGLAGTTLSASNLQTSITRVTEVYGTIKGGGTRVAGVVGFSRNVSYCINHASVQGNGSYCGGICGLTYGNISYCINYGKISNLAYSYTAGIAGYMDVSTDAIQCVNFGYIEGNDRVGGLIGYSYRGDHANCVNFGKVRANSTGAGIVGQINTSTTGSITNCYNAGYVEAGNSSGLVGFTTVINASYYLENSVNGGNDASGLNRTIGQLKTLASDNAWDTTTIWTEDVFISGFNSPMLQIFEDMNLEQSKYYIARYTDYMHTKAYVDVVVDQSNSVEVVTGTTYQGLGQPIYLSTNSGDFVDNLDGTITYVGVEPILVSADASLNPYATASSNQVCTYNWFINGVEVNVDFASARRMGNPSDTGALAGMGQAVLQPNDIIEVRVKATTTVTMGTHMSFRINQIK